MQIIFYLQCYTRFGENLFVEIDAKSYAMEYVAHGTWRCVLTMESDTMKGYRYYIDDSHQSIYYEWRRLYRDLPTIHGNKLQIYDTFERFPLYEPFRSLPFEKLYCKHDNVKPTKILTDGDCLLRVDMPGLLPQEGVGLLGSDILLGDWNATRFLKLDYREDSQWEIVIPNAKALQGCEYKLFVYNEVDGSIVRWEDGFNRYMPFMEGVTILSLSPKQKLSWHGAGVAIPLFSLRSELSWGIGEYVDLHLMIDWALQTGQKVIQLLPINDTTTWFDDRDSYPYKSNSIYALNPLYIRPSAIDGCNIDSLKIYESERKALNSEKTLDYKAVVALKWRCFQDIYKNQWELFLDSKSFESYYNRHREWLLPYAVYSCVRDKFHTANFSEWYKWEHYDALQVIAYANAHRFEVGFYYFLQYHAEKQLLAACKYAHSHGITLKGDLPIGISGNSVEAWMQPELFHMDMQCGAPPDAFSEVGQNWFFPTYNWQAMAADGYDWWKGRFRRMEQFFDAFRIDHILGFFRIWEIPKDDILGLCGHFNPALPYSVDELETYGIVGLLDRFTKPYITNVLVKERLADRAEWAIKTFLDKDSNGLYGFKEHYSTQSSLQEYYDGCGWLPEHHEELKALQLLQCEVLLLEDSWQEGFYHPRILLQQSSSFEALSENEQIAFGLLHDFYFYERHEQFWKESAMEKLPELLATTRMLVCGEDLGMLPACVKPVMEQLEILALEVERMPKTFGDTFLNTREVPYYSVLTSGTHDMSTLRGWWLENSELTQQFYETVLGGHGEAPKECRAVVAEQIINQLLNSNSMLTIFPWQDYMAMDARLRSEDILGERINRPDDPNNFWCYRMHMTLETLLQQQLFNERLKYLITASGR